MSHVDHLHLVDHAPEMADDLAAIAACLDDWGIELVDDWDERSLFNPYLPALGQCDALVRCSKLDGVLVLDLKTGTFKPLDCAIQLSAYACATHEARLVGGSVQLEPLPFDIRTDIGLILHAPWGKGTARIVAVDLIEGRRLAELAVSAHRETLDSGRVVIKDVGSRAVPSAHEEPTSGAAGDTEKEADPEQSARAETVTPAAPSLHARIGDLGQANPSPAIDMAELAKAVESMMAAPPYFDQDIVAVDGKGRYRVSVDNGSSVHLPDLPAHLAYTDPHPKAGQWGYPPKENRWMPHKRVQLIERPDPYVQEAPAAPSLHARIGDLRRRAKILNEQQVITADDAKAFMARHDVPPLSKPDEHTARTVDLWEDWITTLEMALDAGARLPGIVERLEALPVDLYAHVERRSKEATPPVPNLTKPDDVTGPDLDRLEAIMAPVELLHAERVAQVTQALSAFEESQAETLVYWATEHRDVDPEGDVTSLDNLETERVMALCATYAVDDLPKALRTVGTAADVVATARQLAERHQIALPKSGKDVASDRVLAGLVLIHNTESN